jgi:predicted amidophosphoribosyltransferase
MACHETMDVGRAYLCTSCIESCFEKANPNRDDSCTGILLPEKVIFQDAFWNFDKNGKLQYVLHALKYNSMGELGVTLGRLLGEYMLTHPEFVESRGVEWVVGYIPLHSRKLRIRGYNQAQKIAIGVGEVLNFPVLLPQDIIRNRFTKTQTQFTLEERMVNVNHAFEVTNRSAIEGKNILIVDDVFTTGSTSFEFAFTLLEEGANRCAIATVAQA